MVTIYRYDLHSPIVKYSLQYQVVESNMVLKENS